MSTTFSSYYAIGRMCSDNTDEIITDSVIFRIKLPKGSRCLFVPVYEFELLFRMERYLR